MPYLFAALCDLAELALGCKSCKTRILSLPAPPRGPGPNGDRMGGLVYLSSKRASLKVGVLATPGDCRALAERLLGKPASGTFPESIVRGAMCELAYLLAGGVKRRMIGTGPISVGQPSFLAGAIEPKAGWQVRTTDVELDTIAATLVCVMRDETAALF